MKYPDDTLKGPARLQADLRPREEAHVYLSDELMGERDEILIAHAGATYRLRRTANGKLILTK